MPLLSTSRKTTQLAPPLPVENEVLQRAGVVFRRGQFSLLAAAPGVGKTLMANNLVARTRVPTLYFSADSDEWTARTRSCAILSGHKLDQVDDNLHDAAWAAEYTRILSRMDHVDWCFRTDLDMEWIMLRLNAYAELRGEYPQLVVVDNLGNTVEQDEGQELKLNCRELQAIARRLKAHVLATHHVMGDKENGDKPIGLADLIYKIGKLPELVLGLSRAEEGSLLLTVPKQRGGQSRTSWQIPVDYTTATIGGWRVG